MSPLRAFIVFDSVRCTYITAGLQLSQFVRMYVRGSPEPSAHRPDASTRGSVTLPVRVRGRDVIKDPEFEIMFDVRLLVCMGNLDVAIHLSGQEDAP